MFYVLFLFSFFRKKKKEKKEKKEFHKIVNKRHVWFMFFQTAVENNFLLF